MEPESNSRTGIVQYTPALRRRADYLAMARITKTPGQMRQVVAENLQKELEARFPMAPDRCTAFAEASGVKRTTVWRVSRGVIGASLDTLEQIADGLGIPTYVLLVPSEKFARKFQPFDDTGVIPERSHISNTGTRSPLHSSSRQIEDAAGRRRARRHGLKLKKV